MAALEQNQPATIQDANKAISDGPILFDKALSCPWWQSRYYCKCNSLHTKEDSAVVKPTCFFTSSFSFLQVTRFICGVWQSAGRSVAQVFSAKIPPLKGLEAFTRNFALSKIFHYVIVIHKYFVHAAIVGYEAKV